jgi:hypothetical protein
MVAVIPLDGGHNFSDLMSGDMSHIGLQHLEVFTSRNVYDFDDRVCQIEAIFCVTESPFLTPLVGWSREFVYFFI